MKGFLASQPISLCIQKKCNHKIKYFFVSVHLKFDYRRFKATKLLGMNAFVDGTSGTHLQITECL